MDLFLGSLTALFILYVFASYACVGYFLLEKRGKKVTTGDILLWIISPLITPIWLYIAVRYWYNDRYTHKNIEHGV